MECALANYSALVDISICLQLSRLCYARHANKHAGYRYGESEWYSVLCCRCVVPVLREGFFDKTAVNLFLTVTPTLGRPE